MLEIHLDPLGGIAGDMFVAGILDLAPNMERGLQAALGLCPLLDNVECVLSNHNDGILSGRRFKVSLRAGKLPEVGGSEVRDVHHHDHDGRTQTHRHATNHPHPHVTWNTIRNDLTASRLNSTTIGHAIGIFTKLAEAEARVHGKSVDDVSFHEVGAWDSIADIVSAAWLISELKAARWTVGPIPIGSGRVMTAHGLLPIPAPATAILLEGFSTFDDGIPGERVTPTGAAILAYLCDIRPVQAARRLCSSAHGFGSARLPGVSNCLRVLAFESVEPAIDVDSVAVLEFEVDDQTAEETSHSIDNLRARPGVLDVIQFPVFGKKGRMMTHIRLLVEPAAKLDVTAAVFDETTTIGIRHSIVERSILAREKVSVEHDGQIFDLKVVNRPSGRTVKVEADALAAIAGNAARRATRHLVEGIDPTDAGTTEC